VELDATIAAARRDVASALARLPPPTGEGPVPTSLVDLIDEVSPVAPAAVARVFGPCRRQADHA
jgi:hypothetical protein